MRIPLRAGRLFDARDAAGTAPALVVSETFARRYFPDVSRADVVGREVGLGLGGGASYTVVGVVGDVRQGGLDAAPVPTIYLPIEQSPYPAMSMVVRTTSGGPAAAVPAMRDALAAVAPTLALDGVTPLDAVVATSIARQRFALGLTGAFATAALVLCAVGLYAVIATSVAQRTRELGVRPALGATPRDVRALVLREGLRVTAAGVAVGVAGALAASRLLRAQPFEVSALDPLVFVGVTVIAAGVALAATWVPARRATEVDPVLAIRAD